MFLSMPQESLKGDSKGGEGQAAKTASQTNQGETDGNQSKQEDSKGANDSSSLSNELKAHKGTVAAQAKTIETLKNQLGQLTKGLGDALGIPGESGSKDTEVVVQTVLKQVNKLTSRLDKADAKEVRDAVIDNYRDEDGHSLPSNVKDYLRERINPDKPDVEAISAVVAAEHNSLSKLLSASGSKLQIRDIAPEPKNSVSQASGPRPNANEILRAKKERNG